MENYYKTSKWLTMYRRQDQNRILHGILGKVSEVSAHTAQLLDVLKKPMTLSQLSNKLNVSIEEVGPAVNDLLALGYLVVDDEADMPEKIFEKINGAFFPEIRLRLILTEACNFRCAYCFESHSAQNLSTMTMDTAELAIQAFEKEFNLTRQQWPVIKVALFGGEPLLKFDIIPQLVKKLHDRLRGAASKQFIISLNTNGSLIDETIANFLVSNKIYTYVSMDGLHAQHDAVRKDVFGNPTFDRVKKGISTLLSCADDEYRENCLSVMTTLETFNRKSSKKFLTELSNWGIRNVSINRAVDCKSNSLATDTDYYNFFNLIGEIYDWGNTLGINIGGMWGHIRHRLSEGGQLFCAGVGNELLVSPKRSVYPCPMTYKQPGGEVGKIDSNGSVLWNERWPLWKNRHVNKMKDCTDCLIQGVCRGGCPGVAFRTSDSIYDVENCKYYKKLVDFFVWEDIKNKSIVV